MSTRSPMNKRSQAQLQGERTGMARKSASSAKPARAAASSVRIQASSSSARRKQREQGEDLSNLTREEKHARKQERRLQEDRIFTAAQTLMKEDFDYNRYRKVWWILLGVGIVAIVAVWISMIVVNGGQASSAQMAVPQMVGIVAAYVCIIVAFIFDFIKIRPIRNQCRAIAEGMSEAKLNSVIEKGAAEEDRKKVAKASKKK